MGKAADNKQQKRDSLLNTAYKLFTTKGLHDTSIADIVKEAGVAKGTFYLYFKDKYDINNKLVYHRTAILFEAAVDKLRNSETMQAPLIDKIIFVIDYIVDALTENKALLMFISKNLGWGFFRYAIETTQTTEDPVMRKIDEEVIKELKATVNNPELMVYLIVELSGSAIYSSILYDKPIPIDKLKPHLYVTVSDIYEQFRIKE